MTAVPPLRPGDIVRIRAQRWRVVQHIPCDGAAILTVGGCEPGNRDERARFLLPADRVERLAAPHTPRLVRPPRWRRHARVTLSEAVPRIDSLRTARHAGIDIVPYQLEPALAVTRGLGCRVLIADEVGLGKTIQAGLIVSEVLERSPDGHALVVVPAALREQWQDEIERRFRLRAAVLDSVGLARMSAIAGPNANPWAAWPVVIASIDFIKRPEVIRAIESIVWDVAVFDEAHALAGLSERAAAASGLARRARVVVLLSATPHSGDGSSFARLCATGEVARDAPLLLFRRSRQDVGLTASRRTHWLRVRATAAEVRMHRALMAYTGQVCRHQGPAARAARLAMSVLVKRACSSAASLARSVERRLALLSGREAADCIQPLLPFDPPDPSDAEPLALLAAPGLDDQTEERERLEEILELAEAATRHESKLDALHRLLRRSQEPALIFTEYRDTLAHLAAALPGFDTRLLHGGLTSSERRDVLGHFTGGSVRLLLATDAASEGLNLQHRCRLVVNIELPWTPVRLEQRVGRVDRIGQRTRVHAVHLVARDTAEEDIMALLLRRAARAGKALTTQAWDDACLALVTAGLPVPSEVSPAAMPGGTLVTPDLGRIASDEARRLAAARAVHPGGAGLRDETRPVITCIRRRRSRARDLLGYWAYRVSFCDASGHVVWSMVLGVEAIAGTRGDACRPDDVRRVLSAGDLAVRRAVSDYHRRLLGDIVTTAVRLHATALVREQGIAADLQASRARLAGLQPGLFDRRADRLSAAQAEVLDAALARCAARLRRLAECSRLEEGPRELMFAVAVER